MVRRLLTRAGGWTLAVTLLLPWLESSAQEQRFFREGAATAKVKEPVAHRVYQRDRGGRATIPITIESDQKDLSVASVSVSVVGGAQVEGVRYEDGKLVGVPTGGPYDVTFEVKVGGQGVASSTAGPFFVGDLWILAGQSNMEGVGDLIDVQPSHPSVMLLGMDGKWRQADEPLHWLVDSPDPVHSGDPKNRADRSAAQHKTRTKGAGVGLPFAAMMAQQTNVPVGLIACAHGGTSLAQWSPEKKGEGGNSLYGSMLRQLKLAGDRFAGVLWYQGESDAMGGAADAYAKNFMAFINAVRDDLHQPDLPFYFVQIGRFVNANDPKGWNTVQEAQRRIPDRVPNTAVVSVIDLELDDLIHVGTQGLKRTGHRLARIALRELFGQAGATTPTLDRVIKGPNNTLIVKFKGVNMSAGRGAAMMGGMGGMGGGMGGRGAGGQGGFGGGGAGGMAGMMAQVQAISPGSGGNVGLTPARHIGGFSVRDDAGKEIPLIFEAGVGSAKDTVVLKLIGPVPPKANLWYGYGLDPYCNLVDGLDMAVPVFGPIALDEAVRDEPKKDDVKKTEATANRPIKVLIITGDNVAAHDWKGTTQVLNDILAPSGRFNVTTTATPAKDLTDENLAKYDVLLLNYRDTAQGGEDTKWSDENKKAFLKAVHDGGKGLVVHHFASAAFTKPNWDEFERAIAGGWRSQGFHGPKHEFVVKRTEAKHPISDGAPAKFDHVIDELYSNSKLFPETTVLATAYCDASKPRGTGKDEPVIWVNTYGKGRVFNNALGHDTTAMSDKNYQEWVRRGVEWAATGDVKSSN